mgnify:CR=1 FL=1
MQDVSEKIDEYCQEEYGHTNWGYLETYTQKQLESEPYDLDGKIVFWHYDCEENND